MGTDYCCVFCIDGCITIFSRAACFGSKAHVSVVKASDRKCHMRYSWMAPLRQKIIFFNMYGRIDGDGVQISAGQQVEAGGCDLYSRCAESAGEDQSY